MQPMKFEWVTKLIPYSIMWCDYFCMPAIKFLRFVKWVPGIAVDLKQEYISLWCDYQYYIYCSHIQYKLTWVGLQQIGKCPTC